MSFNKKKNIIIAIIICLSIFLVVEIYIRTKDINLLLISTGIIILILGIFFIYLKIFDNYMKSIFQQLSEMISNITDMREKEIFSTLEDTMLSKLQMQVLKLAGILKKQNEELNIERNEIKGLISDISHQLKTPFANLIMYFEFVQEEDLSEKEKEEFIEIMKSSLRKLEFLIESMIKMSRLEGGVIQLNIKNSKLTDTVLIAVRQGYQKAKAKNIEILFEEKDNVILSHDKNWTAEAIYNILDNAIKYTSKNGKIKVTIESYEMFAHVDIEDNGIGITEEEQNKIFKRFYRGKNIKDINGIGIGLYLSRKIISMEGGYIKIKSSKSGSKFSVYLKKE